MANASGQESKWKVMIGILLRKRLKEEQTFILSIRIATQFVFIGDRPALVEDDLSQSRDALTTCCNISSYLGIALRRPTRP
jgi:hypothetical protein